MYTRVPKHNLGLAADRLTLGPGLLPVKNCPVTGPTTSNCDLAFVDEAVVEWL